MGVNSLPKTVTRQRRDCDLNPGPSAPEFSTLTTRLPSHPKLCLQHDFVARVNWRQLIVVFVALASRRQCGHRIADLTRDDQKQKQKHSGLARTDHSYTETPNHNLCTRLRP